MCVGGGGKGGVHEVRVCRGKGVECMDRVCG